VIAARIRHWFESRLPRNDSWTLTQRNLYILPTKAGWAFGITLLVMLLASINYQLNLGYGLTFLLGGAALVSMHQTHGNLRRLTLRVKSPAPVFAGEPATLEIVLGNPAGERHGIGLGLYDARRHGMAWCDVPAHGSASARLRFVPPRRGRHLLPTLLVETHFPLGLFRAWTVWRPLSQSLVYPAAEQPTAALPAAAAVAGSGPTAHVGSGGEFEGVRAYRRGDTLRQVVWKKVARTGDLVSRETSTSTSHELWLDYAQAALPDAEARLSRLTGWVLAAEQRGLRFGLRLPGTELAPASGPAQRHAALEALALWRSPPAASGAQPGPGAT
jgi:uncharacterized protein (DUF58 family)